MSEQIQNGNFSEGFDHWENGPVGYPFVLDAGRAKGQSISGSPAEKNYSVQQQVAIQDQVIAAYITAWRRYEAEAGSVSDGYVRSRILLIKPDLSTKELADETKTAVTGQGNIVNNKDITAEFSQIGNYKLRMASFVASSKDEPEVSIANPYSSWVNNGFTIENPNCKKASGASDISEYTASIYKEFTIGAAASYGRVTVQAKGQFLEGEFSGYCHFIVYFGKSSTPEANKLYDGYLTSGNWETILNNLDIAGYMTSAGTYRLTLVAKVKSSRDPNPFPPPTYLYMQNTCWYGTLSLVAKWYEYDVSNGYWDNISLNVMVKKYKTVIENFEASEVPQKKVKKANKEDMEVSESRSIKVLISRPAEILEMLESFGKKVMKTVKEDIEFLETYSFGTFVKKTASAFEIFEMAESFGKKVMKTVKEDFEMLESYIIKRVKVVKEDMEFTETLIKTIKKEASDELFLGEYLEAKKIAGNREIIYQFLGKTTEWEKSPPVVTPWIKNKTVIGSGG